MRLFYAVWPSPEVTARLAGLDRPHHEAIRWTAGPSWHVTLQFLGEQPEGAVPALSEALVAAGRRRRAREATLGPVTVRLGPAALVVPVSGVDDLASAVAEASAAVGVAARHDPGPFRGHLTIARARGRRRVPPALAGIAVHARWSVDQVTLVRSHLGAAGAAYEVLATAPLRSG